MSWVIYAIVALFILTLSAFLAIALSLKRTGRLVKPFGIIFAGTFISTFILLLPVYREICAETDARVAKAILFSFQGAFQVFTVDADTSMILEYVSDSYYSLILSVLFVIAPTLTFGFVLSLFRGILSGLRFALSRYRDMYVFSELNEKSIALAGDIRKNHLRAAIVFTGVYEKDDDDYYEFLEKAHKIRAICFKKDIVDLNLRAHSSSKPLYLFAINRKEAESMTSSLKLINKCKSENKSGKSHAETVLYTFTTGAESEILLDHTDGTAVRVRRINEVQSLINRLLYTQGVELFDDVCEPETEGGNRKIHAVVVGLGKHGIEMVKALSWYCQMDGYDLEIDAFDMDELAGQKFMMSCPELVAAENDEERRKRGGDAPEYNIKIHSGIDVRTKSFADTVGKMKDITYAFVAIGVDEGNVRIASELRTIFARMGIKPKLRTVVYNSDEVRALRAAKSDDEGAYNIEFIGDIETSYSEDVIMNSKLEEDALNCHRAYAKGDVEVEKKFWQYEYFYRSSVALAIHIVARKHCGIPGADKPISACNEEEKNTIIDLEQRRWNAYMRAEGYVYGSRKSDVGKMHSDIVKPMYLQSDERETVIRVGGYKEISQGKKSADSDIKSGSRSGTRIKSKNK